MWSHGNRLTLLDRAVITGTDSRLQLEIYRKHTHTDQNLLFGSHHPPQHKPGEMREQEARVKDDPGTHGPFTGSILTTDGRTGLFLLLAAVSEKLES